MKMKNHIQYFPSSVLVKIFSYISENDMCNSVPFVCEKWKLASSYSLLLKNAIFEGKSVSSEDICFLLNSTPQLKSVSLVSVDDVVPVLRQICRYNKGLEKLTMRKCSSRGNVVPEEVLINVLLSLPHLQSIGLNETTFQSQKFYRMIASHSTITAIDVSLNKFVTVKDLMTLAHNRNIKEFKMHRRYKEPQISDREMAYLIRTMKSHLELLHLDMNGLGIFTFQEILCCSRLTDLKLNNALHLSTELLTQLPSYLENLRLLKLEGPSTVASGELYLSLFADCSLAQHLDTLKLEYFFSLTNDECCTILEVCSKLSVLSLEGCKNLSAQGISKPITEMPNLCHLNTAFFGESIGISNIILRSKQLNLLIVDESSYILNSLSSLEHNQLQVVKLHRKRYYT